MYQRLAAGLREAIHKGLLHPGASLPPERELAQELGVSRETVRRAVELLTQEGLLRGRQGSGTYVCTRIVEPLSLLASFSEDMARRGFVPGSTWLSREIALPSTADALSLGLSVADSVMRCSRIRLADGEPMAIERATVNAALVGNTIDFGNSLYEALRRHQAAPVRAVQRIRADVADAKTARWLKLDLHAPVLDIERRSFTQEGRPVELTRSIYRGDLYDYVVEMRVASGLPLSPLHGQPNPTPTQPHRRTP
jgi:GntR family transcriptional regulator